MSTTNAVVVVHGIGRQVAGFGDRLRRLTIDAGGRPVAWEEALWSTATQPDQQLLRDRLRLRGLIRAGLVDFGGDIVAYQAVNGTTDKHGQIKNETKAAILRAAAALGPNGGRLTVLAHSLGSVIASDTIWDMQRDGLWPDWVHLEFITCGSPIALYGLQFGIENFTQPIRPARWINCVHPSDPIAFPLKPLNSAYNEAVTEDVVLPLGWRGWVPLAGPVLAHLSYMESPVVAKYLV